MTSKSLHNGLLLLAFLFTTSPVLAGNLTCYQCSRSANEECGTESLLPCHPSKDRCVTHISKDAENGYVLKRECGLGPCGFEDAMMNRGLGLDGCDRSKDEYFCIFCCSKSGCNKDTGAAIWPSVSLILVLTGTAIWIPLQ